MPRKGKSHHVLVVVDDKAGGKESHPGPVALPTTHLVGVDIQHVGLQSLLLGLLVPPSGAAPAPVTTAEEALEPGPHMLSRYRLILVDSDEVGACLRTVLPSLSERIFRLDYFGDLEREDDLSQWSSCLSHMMYAVRY